MACLCKCPPPFFGLSWRLLERIRYMYLQNIPTNNKQTQRQTIITDIHVHTIPHTHNTHAHTHVLSYIRTHACKQNQCDVYLVRSPPVFPALKHPPPQHGHDLRVVLVGERELGYLRHKGAVWTPSLIVGRLANLRLYVGVVHDHIGPEEGRP